MSVYEKLKSTAVNYNQFKESRLQSAIMLVWGCDYKQAFKDGKTHCNAVSLWGILNAMDLFTGGYADFLTICKLKGIIKQNGWVNYYKADIFKMLNIKARVIRYTNIPGELKPDQCFQININDSKHFMSSAVDENKILRLFDTNDRPYGEEINKALLIKKDKVKWVELYERA